MAEIDIRNTTEGAIDTIRVGEPNRGEHAADIIFKNCYEDVQLKDSDSHRALNIDSKEHAESLIKGIQKAIALGWFD